jgi:transposase
MWIMGRSYSSDLRVRIFGSVESGSSCRSAARRFGVSASTSIRLAQRKAATGSLKPARQGRPHGGGKLVPHAELLIRWVETKGDITMPELAAKLETARGVTVHPASLSRFLIARGFSVKKHCWQARPVAVMWHGAARPGGTIVSPGCARNRTGWCSSMRPPPPRK